MKIECLASSSAGNCYILEIKAKGVPVQIMIEAGIPYHEIVEKCNKQHIGLSKTVACLITHGHSDHCKSANDLAKRGVDIYATEYTLQKAKTKGVAVEPYQHYKIARGLVFMPFEVYHDIEGAVGFVIKTEDETIIFVNDCKFWKANLRNFKPTYVFIECNYEDKTVYAQLTELKKVVATGMLDEKELKEANIKIAQHTRNIGAHMSLSGCLRNLKKLNLRYCKAIFLMHLSDRYASEYRMKEAVKMSTGVNTLVCAKKGGIN